MNRYVERTTQPNAPQTKIEGDYSFLRSKKIVYLVNVDRFLLSHRLPLARAARDAGADVIVAARDSGRGAALEKEGIRFVPLPFSRQGTNVFRECATLRTLSGFLKREKPDLLHTVTIKPVLYGSFLSRIFNAWPVVNAVSGLGYVFSQEKKPFLLKPAVSFLYRMALGNPRSVAIFQNPSDMNKFVATGMLPEENAVIIRGSGVNCDHFAPTSFPEKPVVMFPGRMLWDKGVGEFVAAADLLHSEFPDAVFVLVGPAGDDNPKAIGYKEIVEWTSSRPYLEWWGEKEPHEMPDSLARSTIVVLPSYHEGLPKALLEAAACGRPIVTTDIPGCTSIVRDSINGFTVPSKNSVELAAAVKKLLRSRAMIEEFGRNSRRIACSEFREEQVVEQTFEVYRRLLCPGTQNRSSP